MNLNLSLATSTIDIARKPEIGLESEVYFAPENCSLLGTLRTTAAAVGAYVSAGGGQIPTGGRKIHARISSPKALGVVGAMTITLNVTDEDNAADTAVATFHLPSWSGAGSLNQFPIGITSDFVLVTSPAKKVKTIVGLASVTNMTAGNQFQIYTTPDDASFVFIEGITSKGGKFNQQSIVEIPDVYNPAAWTKLGRGESNPVAIGFKDRGALEQLNRFNGSQGTLRIDVVKEGSILAQRQLYSGYYVRAMTERGDGDDVVMATSEGPYEQFLIGYPRFA